MGHRNDSIKSLVLILQGLGLLLTLVASFLGALYMFNGSILIAMLISFIFVIAMFYLVTFFIREKANRRRKGYPPIFYYLFVVYGLMAVALSFFMLHCCNVELFEKSEVQKICSKKLEGIELIHNQYEKVTKAFTQNLKSDILEKLSDAESKKKLGDNTYTATIDILNKPPYSMPKELIEKLIIEPNKDRFVSEFIRGKHQKELKAKQDELFKIGGELMNRTTYINDSKNKVDTWNRFKISQVTREINERIGKDYNVLNSSLEQASVGQLRLFYDGAEFDQAAYLKGDILIDKPFQLASKQMGIITPVILLLFQLLILLPYFLTQGRQY
jgi:hypothetical protein